jgi:hypothetical protein
MNKTTTPVVEKLKVVDAGYVRLEAEMKLAGVPVTIGGYYSVALNAYNPQQVIVAMPMPDKEGDLVNDFLLDEFCDMMGWDDYETTLAIQEAVENR